MLTKSTLKYNNATISGGAISSEGLITIFNSLLAKNNANYGGAVAIINSTSLIGNSTLNINNATQYGGALNVYNSTVTLTNSRLAYNNAIIAGGAISVYNGTLINTNNKLYNNTAPTDPNIHK